MTTELYRKEGPPGPRALSCHALSQDMSADGPEPGTDPKDPGLPLSPSGTLIESFMTDCSGSRAPRLALQHHQ